MARGHRYRQILHNQSGQGALIIALICIVAVGVSLTVVTRDEIPRPHTKITLLRTSITVVQQNIIQILKDPATIVATVNYNTSEFSCLSTECNDGDDFEISLVDSTNAMIIDKTANPGFTNSGAPCENGSVFGDPDCPFQVKLFWTADCNGVATCNTGIVKMRTEVVVNLPPGVSTFNASEYNYSCNAGQMTSLSECVPP
ncbi:MAG: hypothetical protein H6626_00845 [Pseudobdellovibrionaceae bacterium]|nr:MAG: hypothetical protein H6626_00845 [Pseudobdellovibrionaceae bacterium]